MRRLKLQMQMSLDGYVSTGPDDDQGWVTWAWEEIREQVLDLIDSADTLVLGRGLAEGFIPHWHEVVKNPDAPMHDLAEKVVGCRKVVVTNTLQDAPWPNSVLLRGDLAEEIGKLKREAGKDLVVYGGSSMVAALIQADLIDEYHLYLNPVALGSGVPIFDRIGGVRRLKLMESAAFDSGIVLLRYTRG